MIRIDPEFQSYVPALTEDERQQLERNLVADGCRDPLVVWGDILIDGHNRFEICSRLDIAFQTTARDFPDRDAALDWMDANQLGRRNLSPDARRLLLGRRYNRLKKTQGGTGANQHTEQSGQNEHSAPEKTAARLAAEHGVSESTVRRAGDFAEVVDGDDELKAAVQSGQSVASVLKSREPEKAQPPKREANGLEALSRDGLEDEVLGLRAENAELRESIAKLTAERDDLKARLKEATADNQGAVIGKLQKQLQAAKYARDEALAATKRMEYRLKKAEARQAELEAMPVQVDDAA